MIMASIRNLYQQWGVEKYYAQSGGEYANPHLLQIEALLIQNQHRIEFHTALDFCCGSGEVSMVLQKMGFPLPQASDPYTQEAYQKNTGMPCWTHSFDDVIRGALVGQFSSIICSFAMHLCPQKQLYPLVYQLFRHAPQLIIITPHKRPALENFSGITLDFMDYVLTERGKKVFLKAYHSIF